MAGNGKRRQVDRKVCEETLKELEWRGRFEEAERLGLSIGAYCDKNGLRRSRAYWWRSEMRRRQAARGRARDADADADPSDSRAPAVTFVPVTVVEERRPEASLKVLLGSGRQIEVGGAFDDQILIKLVRVLEGPSC